MSLYLWEKKEKKMLDSKAIQSIVFISSTTARIRENECVTIAQTAMNPNNGHHFHTEKGTWESEVEN